MTHLSDVDINFVDVEGTPRLNANDDTKSNYQGDFDKAQFQSVNNVNKEKKMQVSDLKKNYSLS